VNGFREFDVAPSQTVKKYTAPIMDGKFLVEARNAQGEVVYSKEFILKELQEANYKVVISPP